MKLKSFNSLVELSLTFSTEQSCIAYYKQHRWPNGVVSPFDPTSKVYTYRNGTYRCKNTGKNFTVKTGSIFESSKIPFRKWFFAIWLDSSHKKGISSCQLAKDIGVTQKTAWFMLHKIRTSYQFENQHKLGGKGKKVELDETFIGGKNKNRHYDKKVKNSQGRSFKDKTPILGMLERGGKLSCLVVKNTSQKSLTPHILKTVKRGSILCTDEWSGYSKAGKLYNRRIVDHSKKQYVNGDAHTNTLEGYWSILKRGIIGIYHKVTEKHLQRYSYEFVFRYGTRKLSESARFNLVLSNAGNYRITYKQLIKGEG
jgi:transposase-like protein